MSGDVAPYLALITSEHADKPNFVATITAAVQPFADMLAVLSGMPMGFDLDFAIGSQLDDVGLWVGRSRDIQVPLTGVFFSFDTVGLGFDQGAWFGPGDSGTTLFVLPDDAYRTYLRAGVAANHWDGSIPQAYAFYDIIFAGQAVTVEIDDSGEMAMTVTVTGTLDELTNQLFLGHYLDLKPAGVAITLVRA